MPLWPVFVLCGGRGRARRGRGTVGPPAPPPADRAGARPASPRSSGRRVRSLTVLGWTVGMVLARLGATMAVAAALGLPHPVLAALADPAGTRRRLGLPDHAWLDRHRQRRGRGRPREPRHRHGRGTRRRLRDPGARDARQRRRRRAGRAVPRRPSSAVRRWTLRVATVGASVALAAGVGLAVFLAF